MISRIEITIGRLQMLENGCTQLPIQQKKRLIHKMKKTGVCEQLKYVLL